ncbi:MAG: C13 family peptidase [bacterium]
MRRINRSLCKISGLCFLILFVLIESPALSDVNFHVSPKREKPCQYQGTDKKRSPRMKISSQPGEILTIQDPREEELITDLPLEEPRQFEYLMYNGEQVEIPVSIPKGHMLEVAIRDGSLPGDHFYIEILENNRTIGGAKNNGSVVTYSEPVVVSVYAEVIIVRVTYIYGTNIWPMNFFLRFVLLPEGADFVSPDEAAKKEDVIERIIPQVFADIIIRPEMEVKVSPRPVYKNMPITDAIGQEIHRTSDKEWMTFVDLVPEANWGHPCRYAFVDYEKAESVGTFSALLPPGGERYLLENIDKESPIQRLTIGAGSVKVIEEIFSHAHEEFLYEITMPRNARLRVSVRDTGAEGDYWRADTFEGSILLDTTRGDGTNFYSPASSALINSGKASVKISYEKGIDLWHASLLIQLECVATVRERPGGGGISFGVDNGCMGWPIGMPEPIDCTMHGRSSDCTKYAVLISGGGQRESNYIRYWNDISFMYNVLIKTYQFKKENIYILFSDGTNENDDLVIKGEFVNSSTDFDCDGTSDVTYSATKENLEKVFSIDFNEKEIEPEDMLLVYATNHGIPYPSYGEGGGSHHVPEANPNSILILYNGDYVKDTEFAGFINAMDDVEKLRKVFVIGTCYSGGFIDDFQSLPGGACVITSSQGDQLSYRCVARLEENIYEGQYDEFLYLWTSAINGATPSGTSIIADVDRNDDYIISMAEAFEYAQECNMTPEEPQLAKDPLYQVHKRILCGGLSDVSGDESDVIDALIPNVSFESGMWEISYPDSYQGDLTLTWVPCGWRFYEEDESSDFQNTANANDPGVNSFVRPDSQHYYKGNFSALFYAKGDPIEGVNYREEARLLSANFTEIPEAVSFWAYSENNQVDGGAVQREHKLILSLCDASACTEVPLCTIRREMGGSDEAYLHSCTGGQETLGPGPVASSFGEDGSLWYRYTYSWPSERTTPPFYFQIVAQADRWEPDTYSLTTFWVDYAGPSDPNGILIQGDGIEDACAYCNNPSLADPNEGKIMAILSYPGCNFSLYPIYLIDQSADVTSFDLFQGFENLFPIHSLHQRELRGGSLHTTYRLWGLLAGDDYPIVPGESYFLHMGNSTPSTIVVVPADRLLTTPHVF